MKEFKLLSVIVLSMFVNLQSSAQCKGGLDFEEVKKLQPYIYNGQLNRVSMSEGDVAELILTFYRGQDYRIYIYSNNHLEKINFKLYDMERNVLFDSREHDYSMMWDFTSNSTQQLRVEVSVPFSATDNDIVQSGCVAILIGFKESNN